MVQLLSIEDLAILQQQWYNYCPSKTYLLCSNNGTIIVRLRLSYLQQQWYNYCPSKTWLFCNNNGTIIVHLRLSYAVATMVQLLSI